MLVPIVLILLIPSKLNLQDIAQTITSSYTE